MQQWRFDDAGLLLKLLCVALLAGETVGHGHKTKGVTYDGRSLIINGRRELVFSGSIHYPRSPPEMWPEIIQKAKHGGINCIETYVFWNVHEPVQGQFNFQGNYDLVKFIRTVEEAGLWVNLRIGPFIEAEWNHGGFPYWLREVNNITFRTDNEPFKYHMKKFTKMIVNMMKKEKLFASQGGPIVLSQIENEYNNIKAAFKEEGDRYVQWSAKMAASLNTGVPWIMCKQWDAPDPVINACNGRNCGDTFTGPNKPYKPSLWTENWTAQYRVFGDPPSQRSAEDLAFAVARFFSRNGTLVNYYMYYGGTNFGRTTSSFSTTRYYDEAPLDEYGLNKDPKWGHLKDLHSALRLCRKALLWGQPSSITYSTHIEARVYKKPGTQICAAFLANNHTRKDKYITFNGEQYYLPHKSISILPDCKTVVYNTQRVVSQHSARTFVEVEDFSKGHNWTMWQEQIPKVKDCELKYPGCLEQYNTSKDTSDHVWYTTSLHLDEDDLPRRKSLLPVIKIFSFGHAMHAFVNHMYVGSEKGDNIDKSFKFSKAVELKPGVNHISLLSMTVGLPNSGAYLEKKIAGIRHVRIQGLNIGTLDLSNNEWGHKVGLEGEKLHVFTQGGSHRVSWTEAAGNKPLTWYKRYFDAPPGDDPVALDMKSMNKGMVWINGRSIGRYWVSYLSPLGKPTQSEYHIPRPFLKPSDNLMVVLEEAGGNPEEIKLITANRDIICSFLSDNHPPHVKNWERKNSTIHAIVDDPQPKAHLKCPNHKTIHSIQFASFGNSEGLCGNFTRGSCEAPDAKDVVEKACLGKKSCSVLVQAGNFGSNNCPESVEKTLAVQALCV